MAKTISIHDLDAQIGRLQAMHNAQRARFVTLFVRQNKRAPDEAEIAMGVFDLDLAIKRCIKRCIKRYRRWKGDTSKYQPHQGRQECARRIRQGLAA